MLRIDDPEFDRNEHLDSLNDSHGIVVLRSLAARGSGGQHMALPASGNIDFVIHPEVESYSVGRVGNSHAVGWYVISTENFKREENRVMKN